MQGCGPGHAWAREVSRAAGGVRAARWKFFTLAITFHEGRPPADATFPLPALSAARTC